MGIGQATEKEVKGRERDGDDTLYKFLEAAKSSTIERDGMPIYSQMPFMVTIYMYLQVCRAANEKGFAELQLLVPINHNSSFVSRE